MKVGKRTAKLLREAMVLAYVEGSRWGQYHDGRDDTGFPTDSQIVQTVLAASVPLRDLYPTLSKTADAQAADEAIRRRYSEFLAEVVSRSQGGSQ